MDLNEVKKDIEIKDAADEPTEAPEEVTPEDIPEEVTPEEPVAVEVVKVSKKEQKKIDKLEKALSKPVKEVVKDLKKAIVKISDSDNPVVGALFLEEIKFEVFTQVKGKLSKIIKDEGCEKADALLVYLIQKGIIKE